MSESHDVRLSPGLNEQAARIRELESALAAAKEELATLEECRAEHSELRKQANRECNEARRELAAMKAEWKAAGDDLMKPLSSHVKALARQSTPINSTPTDSSLRDGQPAEGEPPRGQFCECGTPIPVQPCCSKCGRRVTHVLASFATPAEASEPVEGRP